MEFNENLYEIIVRDLGLFLEEDIINKYLNLEPIQDIEIKLDNLSEKHNNI